MPLTADDLVDSALGRVGEVTSEYPSARGPMYRRIGMRQRELFALASRANPDRFGTCATANLTAGKADLNDIAAPVPTPERIEAVSIENAGTSPYTAGQRIAIIGVDDDPEVELAPRAYMRDRVIIGVGTDLDLVTSVRVSYPRLPDLFLLTDNAKLVELEAPYDTLLELDLAKWVIAKATQLSTELRTQAVASFAAEEKILLGEFIAHCRDYTPTVSRFGRTRAW